MSANSVSALAYRAREGLRQAYLTMHAHDAGRRRLRAGPAQHLGAYVRGGLSRRDAARVEEHLEECRALHGDLPRAHRGQLRPGRLLAPLLLGTAAAAYLGSAGGAPRRPAWSRCSAGPGTWSSATPPPRRWPASPRPWPWPPACSSPLRPGTVARARGARRQPDGRRGGRPAGARPGRPAGPRRGDPRDAATRARPRPGPRPPGRRRRPGPAPTATRRDRPRRHRTATRRPTPTRLRRAGPTPSRPGADGRPPGGRPRPTSPDRPPGRRR